MKDLGGNWPRKKFVSGETQCAVSQAKLMHGRISCWVFLADGFLTVCFKNHPALSVFEMDCPLPWSPELWEAEDAETFNSLLSKGPTRGSQPPLKDVVSELLEKSESEPPISWSLSLSPEDLLIIIYGIVPCLQFSCHGTDI